MRIVISGGGTGGHVYPALAVAAQLDKAAALVQAEAAKADAAQVSGAGEAKAPTKVDVVWVGSVGGMEQALVERDGLRFRGIATGKIRGAGPLNVLRSALKMAAGVRQSLGILDQERPDVCFVTGGYVCAPMVAACRLRRVPVLIYLPDMTPGLSIRLMSKFAQRVAVSFAEVAGQFGGLAPQGKSVVTGYPVRQELVTAAQNRAEARRELAQRLERPLADDQLPLVLVWGGSQGSRTINQATWASLPSILPECHVLHVIGVRDWGQQNAEMPPLSEAEAKRYHPVDYLHGEMMVALAAADVTVARAGASTLGEFPVARLPSILIPLPFAGVAQAKNAEQLTKAGAALVVDDDKLKAQLAPTLLSLLHDTERRQAMERALGQMARPDAALAIAQELCKLAVGH